jgi:pilus assembly protein CpaE
MRAVVAHESLEQGEPIRRTLLGMGVECGAADCVARSDLLVRLAQSPTDLILVAVGTQWDGARSAIREALEQTSAPVLAVGPTNDAPQILKTLQCGAREYLDADRLQVDLEAALEKLRMTGAVKESHQGLVVGVVSATPGCGVTTIATNLAFTWATKYPGQVALIEFGTEASDLALSLDLDPRHTVSDVVENWQRMDAALIKRSVVGHAGGVQVLAQKPESLRTDPMDPQAVKKAVLLLKTMYRPVVLDVGHVLGEEQYQALKLCDVVALVVRLDVPGLRQARRLMRDLEEKGVARDRIRLVANRYGQKGQLGWKKAEEALGASFTEYLPEDSGKLNNALNKGIPLVSASRHSSIARRFAKLAHQLNGKLK